MIRGAVVVPVFGVLLVWGVAGQTVVRGGECSSNDQCIKRPTCDANGQCQWRDSFGCTDDDGCARDSYADAQCHTDGNEQLCMVPVVRGEQCDPSLYEYCVESTCLHQSTYRVNSEIIWKAGDEAKLADRDRLQEEWKDAWMKCMVKVPLGDSCDKSGSTTMCFDGDVKGGECLSTDDGDKCKVRKDRGQDCTGAHDLCMGSICTDGICEAPWWSLTSYDERDDSNPWMFIAGCIVGFCVLALAISLWYTSEWTKRRAESRDGIRNQEAGNCASQAGASPSPDSAREAQGFAPGLQQQSPQMLQGQILGQQMFQTQMNPQQMCLPPPNQQMSAQVMTQPQMPHQHNVSLTTVGVPTMVPPGYGAGGFRPSDTE